MSDLEYREPLTGEEKIRALETVVSCAAKIQTQMSDTFEFACADVGEIEYEDFEEIAHLVAKYGHHAITAYEAVRRSIQDGKRVDPISCRCCHDGEDYKAARAEIEKLEAEEIILWDARFQAKAKENRCGRAHPSSGVKCAREKDHEGPHHRFERKFDKTEWADEEPIK